MVLHSPNHFIPLVWFCLTLTAATVGVFYLLVTLGYALVTV